MGAAKPVILLAFANDPADGINYLRNLPEEARRLRAALEYAEAQGLCEFEVRYNASLDDILGAFQQPKLRGRIAVFHYGGHADSYELLFQSSPGNLQRIDGRGFAAFLAEQRSLQLVFLNACTTEPQIDGLLAANVQVVIATSQEVDDGVAAELAARFYQELAHGASIGASYRQAVAALRAQKGDDPALFYAGGGVPPQEEDAADAEQPASDAAQAGVEAGGSTSGGYWPWLLRTRRGAEAAIEWSLPQAAGDPLFGLPSLPPKPLPDSPYQRALEYYTRDMAELFFGRGRQIRELYQRVTAAGHSSVILYYGQSGVGKSSLLDAGLAPRLEATHAVLYARRDRALGLLGTLQKQLAAGDAPAAAADTTPTALVQAWLAAEQRLGKPVVLILDQAEEVFSRRNPERPQELEEFAAALSAIEGSGQGKPSGALLLGFRKERLAEIETALRDQRVDFAKLFLGPLDMEGIQEVFWGPVHNERLRAKYGLAVEDNLPELVAHDLTADPDSPVAPTLNILLRKLWAAATAQAASAPHFTVALYEQLRRDGILLDDFLRQQTATLAQEQPDSVASGLLLDLWAFHTTALGTSDQRDADEVKAAYGQQPSIEALILRSKELYVLADPPGDSAAPANGGTRLAHDTLAPLVRRDFATSALPGQQARRLLESRAIDWQGDRSGPLLDDAALAVIDKGLGGMRSLSGPEQRLLIASRQAQAKRARSRRLVRSAAAAVAVVVLALLVITFLIWDSGRLQGERADREAAERIAAEERADREAAERQAADARAELQTAEREAAEERSRANQLARQSADERERAAESQRIAQLAEQQLEIDPVIGLHLALAANSVPPSVSNAEYALRQAVLTSRERKYITATVDLPDQVALRGDRLAVGGVSPAVYDVELNPQRFAMPPGFANIVGLRWGSDMRLLGWNNRAAWVAGGGAPRQFPVQVDADDQVRCAEWQPDQEWVAICTWNNLYAWQPQSGRVITITTELDTPELGTEPRSIAWSRDGRWLAGMGAKLVLWDSATPAAAAQVFYPPAEPGHWVAFAAWLPDDRSLVAAWSVPFGDAPLHTWRADTAALETVALPPALSEYIEVNLLYAPDPQTGAPRLLHWSRDGLLALYDLDSGELIRAGEVPLNLRQPLLSPDGEHAVGYAADGTAMVWSLPDLVVSARLDRTNHFVASSLTSAAWLDDNTLILGDSSGLLQVVEMNYMASGTAITRLAGNSPGERLAQTLRLADGRLLTVGLFDGPTGASLRIWQLDPVTIAPGESLPAASDPLQRRLHRSLPLPPDLPSGIVYDWQADDVLTVGNTEQVAQWQLGGPAAVLPADEELYRYSLAPDKVQVLRYGDETDGQIWRLDTAGWQPTTATLPGPLADAVWTPHGILAGYADGTSALVDPAGGDPRPLPPGTLVEGSTMLAPDLLLAARTGEIALWNLASDRLVISQTVPSAARLRLDAAAADGSTFVWRSPFGDLYALGVDAAQETLTERWRSPSASLNRPPSALHPTQPLLATVDKGDAVIVDLEQGAVVWQSTGTAAVADQSFLDVQWSTDGQYFITQAEVPQPSTFPISIGVWRWDTDQQRPVLLQEMPSSGLLAVSPGAQSVLALPPGQLPADALLVYSLFANAAQLRQDLPAGCAEAQSAPASPITETAQLRQDLPASCLLTRSFDETQRQAFGVQGR